MSDSTSTFEVHWVPCDDCHGTGTLLEWGRRKVTCNKCQGSGHYLMTFVSCDH